MLKQFAFGILFCLLALLRYASAQVPVIGETPNGNINSVNTVFTLQNSSLTSSVAVYRNGMREKQGLDYTLLHNTILFSAQTVPILGDVLLVDYVMQAPQQKAFQYSRSITIDHTKVPNTDEINFPVLVSGVYNYLATTANGGHVQSLNGSDVIFTSDPAGQNLLNWELDSYNPTTGAVNFWVQLPTVSHITDTVFYVFYGNAAISTFQGNAAGTWDGNFKGVYHFPYGTLFAHDSTLQGNNGVINGATPTMGQIDGGANLNGNSQYITMGNVLDIGASDTTLSAWISPPNQNQATTFIAKRQNTSPFPQYDFGVGSINSMGGFVSGKTLFCAFFDGTTLAGGAQFYHTQNNIIDGNWHFVVCTRGSGGVAIYVDGLNQPLVADIANTTKRNTSNTASFNIGYQNDSISYFNGNIDEARVATIARSADWIATEYNNQNSPPTFYTIGSEVANASASSATFRSAK